MALEDRFGHKQLTEYESKELLREYGVPVVEEKLAKTAEEAQEAAEEIGLPVVLKVESRDVQHKTDAGGVEMVESLEEVEGAFEKIKERVKDHKEGADIDGILVEEMLEGDQFIVGLNTDPQFGQVLMFGLGGIYVEVFKDVTFRVVPVEDRDIDSMIDDLLSKPLLEGVRNKEAADMEKLKSALKRVSELGEEHPEIKELDINPLFINGSTIKAADALIKLK